VLPRKDEMRRRKKVIMAFRIIPEKWTSHKKELEIKSQSGLKLFKVLGKDRC
jgi:hypothetical protein